MSFTNDTTQPFQGNATHPSPSSPWADTTPNFMGGFDLLSLLPPFLRPHAWLLLLLVGRFGQTIMSTLSSRWNNFLGTIFFFANFTDSDASYGMFSYIIHILPLTSLTMQTECYSGYQSKHHGVRAFLAITGTLYSLYSLDNAREVEIRTPKHWKEGGDSRVIPHGEKPEYIPSIDSTYSFWYRNRWVTVTRTQDVRVNAMRENRLAIK
jgi:hypothetical protein